MAISIIIPTFNRAGLIRYTLDSLDKGRHPGISLEVIVVDDGSTDDTWTMVAKHYPDVVLLKNKGKGAAAARNTGLAAAKGSYIMYLDSDDLVGERYFEQKLAMLEQQPELSAVYGLYEFFKSDGEFKTSDIIFKHKYPLIFSADKTKEHLIHYLGGNFLPPHTLIWRKDILVKIGGHDEKLAINQDVDLFIRAIFNGLKISSPKGDDTKVYVRGHELDARVGDPRNAGRKWVQMLDLRKQVFKDLDKYGYGDAACYTAMSNYLFGIWKLIRHTEPGIAAEFLALAKEIHWPVRIKGNAGYRLLSSFFGPVRAVNMKYFLLKRD